MKDRLGLHSAFCILHSALILLAVVHPCLAQRAQIPGGLQQLPPDVAKQLPARSYGQQTDAFRRLLFELRFQPLHDFTELRANPSEALLVVLGDPSCLSKANFPEGMRMFVDQGGAALIATDWETRGEAGENLIHLAGVTVTGEKLVCRSENPNDLYDTSQYCPFVKPLGEMLPLKGSPDTLGVLAAALGAGSRPALFRHPHPERRDELRVATNVPSRLKTRRWWLPDGIYRLAALPGEYVDVETHFRQHTEVYKTPLFAVGGTFGKGRVLVLADHSIFINRMILPRDNDNLEFAANCLHWLRGGVSTPMEALRAARSLDALQQLAGSRNKVLFLEDGTIRTDFEVPLKPMSLKPSFASEPAIVAAVDKTLARLEDNDFFNRQIIESMDQLPGGRQRVIRYAVYLLTLAACLLLGYRFLWQSRYRPESTLPVLAEAVSRQEPRLPLLDQRRRALLRSGNVWEIVHRLAREYFESAGVPLTHAAPPRVEMKGGNRWQRWRINRRLARWWKLARGDAPLVISPTALPRWLRELEKLKSALRDGMITLD